jgi:hypothetical protein
MVYLSNLRLADLGCKIAGGKVRGELCVRRCAATAQTDLSQIVLGANGATR